MTRFAVLPDERGLILGVDKTGIFKKGIVYEVKEILGEIVFSPIGEYVLPEKGYPSKNSESNIIVTSGLHLTTKKELDEKN